MRIWKAFFPVEETTPNINSIHDRLKTALPETEETELVVIACIAGLMARVAYSDLEIDERESKAMRIGLKEFTDLSPSEIDILVTILPLEIILKKSKVRWTNPSLQIALLLRQDLSLS